MKLNKLKIFLQIWGVHIFVYYTCYGILVKIFLLFEENNSFQNVFEEFYLLPFAGIALGIMGYVDNFPAFIVLPIVFMRVLINYKFKYKWFLAYCIAVILLYLLDYAWLCIDNKNNMFISYYDAIVLIIPSLAVAILVNWLVFKNKYKRLANQTEIDNSRI